MQNVIVNNVRGVSFLSLLTLLFIFLKLNGTIQWSWLWVLGPLWIPFAVVFVFLGVASIFGYFKFKK